MRPAKNMYSTQEEWQKALVQWMNEKPTTSNGKKFMVFESENISFETFMFEGDLLDFAETYFSTAEWEEVSAFALENKYTIVVEDDERYEELGIMIDDAFQAEEESKYPVQGVKSADDIYSTVSSGYDKNSEWDDDYRVRWQVNEN